jgi:hypothetical protein
MAGDKAQAMVAVLDQAPVAATIEAFEAVMQKFASQNGANFNSSGRVPPNGNAGKIAGYETMSFEQRRAAQDNQRRGGR